jgi:rod shape-determining protein MreD
MKRPVPAWLVSGSIIAALGLMLLPTPDFLRYAQPYWVAMVLAYWWMESPGRVGLVSGFVAGLAVDLLTGDVMGMHAMGLVFSGFIALRFQRQLRLFPIWQKAIAVLGLLVNERLIYLALLALADQPLPDWRLWLAPLVGTVVWPWTFLLLDDLRLRTRQRKK